MRAEAAAGRRITAASMAATVFIDLLRPGDMDGEPAPDLPIPPSFSVVGEGAGADHG
jgi:hypothetical protein